jgi:MFS family permease
MTRSATTRSRGSSPLLSGSFGNFVEWYDWGIFAVLATVFSSQIFAAHDDAASLLQTLATFAVGFAARPIGAVVLSPLGDKLGRKRLLSLAILMMAGGSLVIGLTPGFDTIGVLAPIVFVAARVLQGISAGAEFQSASGFVVEHAPPTRRALYGSATLISAIMGSLCATATGALLTATLDAEALAAWGWRLPFILGAALGLVGLYLRTRAPETPAFEEAADHEKIVRSPLRVVLAEHKVTMLRIFAISVYTSPYYLWTVFLPTYAHLASGLPLDQTFAGGIIALIVMLCALPLLGMLSDRVGRKPMLLVCPVGMTLLAYPMLTLLERPDFWTFLAVDIVGCLLIGCTSATQSATYCELVPTAEVRITAIGVPYNISSALVGGTTPLIATALATSGNGEWVSALVIGLMAFSATVLFFMPEVRGRELGRTANHSRTAVVEPGRSVDGIGA